MAAHGPIRFDATRTAGARILGQHGDHIDRHGGGGADRAGVSFGSSRRGRSLRLCRQAVASLAGVLGLTVVGFLIGGLWATKTRPGASGGLAMAGSPSSL